LIRFQLAAFAQRRCGKSTSGPIGRAPRLSPKLRRRMELMKSVSEPFNRHII